MSTQLVRRRVTVIGLLSVCLAAPLQAAAVQHAPRTVGAPAAAVSNVTIAWADAQHTGIRVTWDDAAPQANQVGFVSSAVDPPDGVGGSLVQVAAGSPNEAVLTRTPERIYLLQVRVWAGTGPGAVPGADSALFDTIRPTTHLTLEPHADRTVRFRWTLETPVDTTPGDPLDLPQPTGPVTYRIASQQGQSPPVWNPVSGPLTGLSYDAPADFGGFYFPGVKRFRVDPEPVNEWGSYAYPAVLSDSQATASAVPAVRTWSTSTRVTGKVLQVDSAEFGGSLVGSPGRQVRAEARPAIGAPWLLLGTVNTDQSGNFAISIGSPGTRDLRYVVLPKAGVTSQHGTVVSGGHSQVVTRIAAAKFADPTVLYGQRASALLVAGPAASQHTLLQYRTTTGVWKSLVGRTLVGGKASYTFTWVHRGRTAFRWYVPASKYGVYQVGSAYSAAFVLTVS